MKTIKLTNKTAEIVALGAPYDFDSTVFKPAYYPAQNSFYEKGKYWFVLKFKNKIYGIKLVNRGEARNPKVQITAFSKTKLSQKEFEEIIKELSFRFEFNRDISDFYKKNKNNKVLKPFIKKWYGMHGSCPEDLYGLLMIGIFLQNTVVRRSVQMTQLMFEKYGTKVKFDDKELFCFWEPEEMMKVKEEALRKLKVGYRAKLFIKLSRSFVEEKINEIELRKLPTEEAKKTLIKLYGVGPETARILLTEALHHYEIFDHVAPWQQKIYSRLLFNKKLAPTNKIIKYIKNNWGEWANLAAGYIWEDIFWRRKHGEKIPWLEKEIRL